MPFGSSGKIHYWRLLFSFGILLGGVNPTISHKATNHRSVIRPHLSQDTESLFFWGGGGDSIYCCVANVKQERETIGFYLVLLMKQPRPWLCVCVCWQHKLLRQLAELGLFQVLGNPSVMVPGSSRDVI